MFLYEKRIVHTQKPIHRIVFSNDPETLQEVYVPHDHLNGADPRWLYPYLGKMTAKELAYSYEIWLRSFTAFPEAFEWSPLCKHIQAKIFNYLKEHLKGNPLRYMSTLSITNQTRGSHVLHLIRKEYGFTSPLQIMLTVLIDAQKPTYQAKNGATSLFTSGTARQRG